MEDEMNGGKGMSPRKAMASESGSFGVGKLPGADGGQARHITPETGAGGTLSDSERGTKTSVAGSGAFGRQAAPDHGPVKDHFTRSGRV